MINDAPTSASANLVFVTRLRGNTEPGFPRRYVGTDKDGSTPVFQSKA
jgi:hypothetical protein